MKIQFKRVAAIAILFTSLGMVNAAAANADVINAPSNAGKIKQVDSGNVLKDYDDSAITAVNNTSPAGNPTRKYNKSSLNEGDTITANSYSTTANSTSPLNFSTQSYLPDGFNVTNYQHGNYQSVALDNNNNVYFVESNGSNTNEGIVVKFDAAKLAKLGVANNITAIWQAFDYFNPYTTQGLAHNQQYDAIYLTIQGPQQAIDGLTDKVNSAKSAQNNQNNYKKKAQKWYYYWKAKKPSKVKNNKKATKASKQKAAKANKTRTAKMKSWMANYQKHKASAASYTKKIKGYQKSIATYQKQVDKVKKQYPNMFQYVDIAKAAKLSPQINIGHGQTLSFNPANKHLYLAEDNSLSDLSTDQNNQVVEMDPNTLKPIREYNFQMLHNTTSGTKNLQLHTLAFDKAGNAYWGRKSGSGYMFFYGRLDQDSVSFSASQTKLAKRGGDPNQGIAVSPTNNRLYVVSDDILTSIPTKNIRNSSIKANSPHYYEFNSKREFESLAFDGDGYGYLLALWPPELLKSNAH